MAGFVFIIAIIGGFIGLMYGNMIFASIIVGFFAFIYALIAYFAGANMVLALSGAKLANKQDHAYYINTVEGLAIAAGIPTPKAYIIDDPSLNAFATGRDPKHAAVTVTTGLLQKLNRQELEGVVAHEIAHIKMYDIRTMLIASVMVGLVIMLSDFMLRSVFFSTHSRRSNNGGGKGAMIMIVIAIILAILAPIVAQLIKLAVSRKREFVADAEGARLTRYPEGLASALERIKGDPDPLIDGANKATAHMYISTPFRKKKNFWNNLFSTHPPIDERIKRLRSM